LNKIVSVILYREKKFNKKLVADGIQKTWAEKSQPSFFEAVI